MTKRQYILKCLDKLRATTDIFIKWYNQIFKPYETLKAKNNCLLILDKAPSHFNPKVIDLFDTNQQQYIYIPPDLTPYLQPLDIGINKPFKSRIKNYYLKNQISKCDKMDSSIINEFNKISKEYDSWWNEKD